jgi:ADP-heptose:LPS heptosyltransferase
MYNKNLNNMQITEVVKALRQRGCYVYSSHTGDIEILSKLEVPILQGGLKKWMGYVYAADYVISVDTSTFHMAGGIKKPLVGIFTFTDGKIYGKFYKFKLIQKHRDNGDWSCGPCYNWPACPKTDKNPKPCLTEITSKMIMDGIEEMFKEWPLSQLPLPQGEGLGTN